jgi:FkbM family methyltransferase
MLEELESLRFFSLEELYSLSLNKLFKKRDDTSDLSYRRHTIRDILKKEAGIELTADGFLIKNFDGFDFFARKNSSDLEVFNQVWIKKEYQPVVDYVRERKLAVNNMLDCGANVGYTSLYFSKHFDTANIISVEADEQNANMVHKNVQLNKATNIETLHKAIWYRTALLKITHTFRDGKNWSYTVEETDDEKEASVEATSISDIAAKYGWPIIDILKIDIEGGERFLFQNNYHETFLPRTKCVVIEIHDEFNARQAIYDAFSRHHFNYVESGELTIAFNNDLV